MWCCFLHAPNTITSVLDGLSSPMTNLLCAFAEWCWQPHTAATVASFGSLIYLSSLPFLTLLPGEHASEQLAPEQCCTINGINKVRTHGNRRLPMPPLLDLLNGTQLYKPEISMVVRLLCHRITGAYLQPLLSPLRCRTQAVGARH